MRNQCLVTMIAATLYFSTSPAALSQTCGVAGSIDERLADCKETLLQQSEITTSQGDTWHVVTAQDGARLLQAPNGQIWTQTYHQRLHRHHAADLCRNPIFSPEFKGYISEGFGLPLAAELREALDLGLAEVSPVTQQTFWLSGMHGDIIGAAYDVVSRAEITRPIDVLLSVRCVLRPDR